MRAINITFKIFLQPQPKHKEKKKKGKASIVDKSSADFLYRVEDKKRQMPLVTVHLQETCMRTNDARVKTGPIPLPWEIKEMTPLQAAPKTQGQVLMAALPFSS